MFRQGIFWWTNFWSFLALFTFTGADYIVDNTNATITYTPPTLWSLNTQVTFVNGSVAIIDWNRLYYQKA